jgi:hypothetical protein
VSDFLRTVGNFFDATVETVHFPADRFHSPHQIFLVNTREAAALDNDVAANQNGIDRLTAFTEDELVDDISQWAKPQGRLKQN